MPSRRALLIAGLPLALVLAGGGAFAQGQDRDRDRDPDLDRERLRTDDPDDRPIYGRELMTEQERLAYQERMRNARTEEERERIRAEHHASMQQRANQRGVTLPDGPPAQGMGAGRRIGSAGGGQGRGSRR